ncbi:MAG: hypothetical protein U0531_04445 [Dehalococcoidia bacterium]
MESVRLFFEHLLAVVIYSALAIVIALALFEALNRRFGLMREVFEENSVAAGILAGSFVLGIFYTVTQIVVS